MNTKNINYNLEQEKEILNKLESFDFYESFIEPPIIPLVKFLRNNGINTTGSCAHGKYVVFQCNSRHDKNMNFPTVDHVRALVHKFGHNNFHFIHEDSEMPVLVIDEELELKNREKL